MGLLRESDTTQPDDWLEILKYSILSTRADDIDQCPSGDVGLGNRVKSLVTAADDWNSYVEAVKSKRYTHTRISRLFMQIILGINRSNYEVTNPQYVRVLGFNNRGRELLSEINSDESNRLPVITNINKQREELSTEGLKQLDLDVHAADVYNLVTGRDIAAKSDYRMKPVIK